MLDGARFFGGDPWLRSIVEFQPMFSSRAEIGTDLANLTGGAFLIAFIARGRVLGPWSLGHSIDVIGAKPVIIDNFGSMPDGTVFQNAIDAMLVTRADVLRTYCRTRNVRYLVLPHPACQPAMAATVGLDGKYYPSRHTVWSRLYSGEQIAGFTLVRNGAVRVWQVEP